MEIWGTSGYIYKTTYGQIGSIPPSGYPCNCPPVYMWYCTDCYTDHMRTLTFSNLIFNDCAVVGGAYRVKVTAQTFPSVVDVYTEVTGGGSWNAISGTISYEVYRTSATTCSTPSALMATVNSSPLRFELGKYNNTDWWVRAYIVNAAASSGGVNFNYAFYSRTANPSGTWKADGGYCNWQHPTSACLNSNSTLQQQMMLNTPTSSTALCTLS